jgi:hypothetical protein
LARHRSTILCSWGSYRQYVPSVSTSSR